MPLSPFYLEDKYPNMFQSLSWFNQDSYYPSATYFSGGSYNEAPFGGGVIKNPADYAYVLYDSNYVTRFQFVTNSASGTIHSFDMIFSFPRSFISNVDISMFIDNNMYSAILQIYGSLGGTYTLFKDTGLISPTAVTIESCTPNTELTNIKLVGYTSSPSPIGPLTFDLAKVSMRGYLPDSGIRLQTSHGVQKLAMDPAGSAFRVSTSAGTRSLALVDTTDVYASPLRVQKGGLTYAIAQSGP